MTPDQAINEYARIEAELKSARKEVLAKEGISEDGLHKLHDDAFSLMGELDRVETQWGMVQKIVARDIDYRGRRQTAEDHEKHPMFKQRLKLLTKREAKA